MNEVLMINIYLCNKKSAHFEKKKADFLWIRVYLGGRVWKGSKSVRCSPYFINFIFQDRFSSYLQSLLIDMADKCSLHIYV